MQVSLSSTSGRDARFRCCSAALAPAQISAACCGPAWSVCPHWSLPQSCTHQLQGEDILPADTCQELTRSAGSMTQSAYVSPLKPPSPFDVPAAGTKLSRRSPRAPSRLGVGSRRCCTRSPAQVKRPCQQHGMGGHGSVLLHFDQLSLGYSCRTRKQPDSTAGICAACLAVAPPCCSAVQL